MRRRALVISNLFPLPAEPQRGTFNRQHYSALQEHMDVRALCPVAWTTRLSRPAKRPGAPSTLPISYLRYFYTPRVLRNRYGEFMWQSIRRRALAIARDFAPDIIVGSWSYPDGYAALQLAQTLGLPCAIQVLGSDVNQLDSFPERAGPTWRTLRQADLVLPVSQALRDRIVAEGIDSSRVQVVYRGIDRSLFHPLDGSMERRSLGLCETGKHLLYIGNLVPVKSVQTLLAASALLRREHGLAHRVHIIGGGPLRAELEREAGDLGIADEVHFHGVLPHAELPRWMAACDLVVLPSLHEGVPNVLLEAISAQRPYVASRTGGIPEISRHDGCRLFTPGDASGLANAITSMLDSTAVPDARALPAGSWGQAGANLAAALSLAIEASKPGSPSTADRAGADSRNRQNMQNEK